MTSLNTFVAMVRFSDQSKTKFHIQNVPDDLDTVRGIINHELADRSISSILILAAPIGA